MTHDFHFYVTFMCARNAGYSLKDSLKIALFADAVDGGNPKCAQKYSSAYAELTYCKKWYRPLSVFNLGHSVNSFHSIGGSLVAVPWMAFHFLPSLEIDTSGASVSKKASKRRRPILARGSNPRTSQQEQKNSIKLEKGLVCTHDSRFAKELINHTCDMAPSNPSGTSHDVELLAKLGVRAHVIADLFAHEGFAGCRSVNINALAHANTLNNKEGRDKLRYSLESAAGVSLMKNMKMSRLGHGQAGQRPDEPFVRFSCQRSSGGTFTKNNRDLFGRAVMAVTESLRGNKGRLDYSKWAKFENEKKYRYRWNCIVAGMNNSRESRIDFLRSLIICKETKSKDTNPYEIGLHDRSDYWVFQKTIWRHCAIAFSRAVDQHLKWFHETFFEITGCSVAEYMQVSVLWPFSGDSDWHSININRTLISDPKEKFQLVGSRKKRGLKDYGKISGLQLGIHYMKENMRGNSWEKKDKRKVAEALKPSDVLDSYKSLENICYY